MNVLFGKDNARKSTRQVRQYLWIAIALAMVAGISIKGFWDTRFADLRMRYRNKMARGDVLNVKFEQINPLGFEATQLRDMFNDIIPSESFEGDVSVLTFDDRKSGVSMRFEWHPGGKRKSNWTYNAPPRPSRLPIEEYFAVRPWLVPVVGNYFMPAFYLPWLVLLAVGCKGVIERRLAGVLLVVYAASCSLLLLMAPIPLTDNIFSEAGFYSAVLLAASVAVCWWLHRARLPWWSCMQCGYNLTGNTTGACPECGSEVPAETQGRLKAR